MEVLLLRLDAPLISFGGPMVDQHGVVQAFPPRSLLVGLMANAMGYDHTDYAQTQRLQERVQYAARIDRPGEALVDYQTVDLGQDILLPEKSGWTTRGKVANRDGGSSKGTHIRYRHYRADSIHTVALTLTGEEQPTITEVQAALDTPARPLFLGRKTCIPSSRLTLDVVESESPLHALAQVPRVSPRGVLGPLEGWWDEALNTDAPGLSGPFERVQTTDERDWKNQIHGGQRTLWRGRILPPDTKGGAYA